MNPWISETTRAGPVPWAEFRVDPARCEASNAAVHASPLLLLSVLMLVAYGFEVSSPRTRIPTVILLLGLGIACRWLLDRMGVVTAELDGVLPTLGTFGLILIVFEGALELEFRPEAKAVAVRALLVALLPMLALGAGLATYLVHETGCELRIALLHALPFAVISSAVAVPTARVFRRDTSEFVVYESSLSDILGVLAFNFVLTSQTFELSVALKFGGQLLAILALAVVGSVLLALLVAKLRHRVKFGPILAFVVLLYSVSKALHLPALVLILVFGLCLANFRKLAQRRVFRFLDPAEVEQQVHRFSELTAEVTFVVRIAFFILFGFVLDVAALVDLGTLAVAFGILGAILILRAITLRAFRLPAMPLLFIAPRGLITVLLLLSIPTELRLPFVSDGLTTQLVILSALLMMVATIGGGRAEVAHENMRTSHPPTP